MSAQLQEMPRTRRLVPALFMRWSRLNVKFFFFPGPRATREKINSGYHCLVLEQGGEIFGYSVIVRKVEEGHLLTAESSPAGSRRKGWGERLLREFIHLAKERLARTMFLDVRESNRAAARLYERLGFKQICKRRGYYPAMGGRDYSLVMELGAMSAKSDARHARRELGAQ